MTDVAGTEVHIHHVVYRSSPHIQAADRTALPQLGAQHPGQRSAAAQRGAIALVTSRQFSGTARDAEMHAAMCARLGDMGRRSGGPFGASAESLAGGDATWTHTASEHPASSWVVAGCRSAASLVEVGEERPGGDDLRGRAEVSGEGAVGGDHFQPATVKLRDELPDAVVGGVGPRRVGYRTTTPK